MWERIGELLAFKDFVHLRTCCKSFRDLPLPKTISSCKPRHFLALAYVTRHCLQAQALQLDISNIKFDKLGISRQLQPLLDQLSSQPSYPLKQLMVTGDVQSSKAANQVWLSAVLQRLAQLEVFIYSTDNVMHLPTLQHLAHLVLDLQQRQPPCHRCDACEEKNEDDDSNILGHMPCLQTLKLSWSQRQAHEQHPDFCSRYSMDFRSFKRLRYLALENIAPKNLGWQVSKGCYVAVTGGPGMMSFRGPENLLDGVPAEAQPPALLRRVSRQLSSMHLVCPEVVLDLHPVLDPGEQQAPVNPANLLLGGVYPALRILQLTCKGVGSYDDPLVLGPPFSSLEVLRIHAAKNVYLALKSQVQLRVLKLESLTGFLHLQKTTDVKVCAQKVVHAFFRGMLLGQGMPNLATYLADRLKGTVSMSERQRGTYVFDICCPACAQECRADPLHCTCGACIACLRREGRVSFG